MKLIVITETNYELTNIITVITEDKFEELKEKLISNAIEKLKESSENSINSIAPYKIFLGNKYFTKNTFGIKYHSSQLVNNQYIERDETINYNYQYITLNEF